MPVNPQAESAHGQPQPAMRPIERRIVAMRTEGLTFDEIGDRFKCSPEHVERIYRWSGYERERGDGPKAWRAIGERVLAMRSDGMSHDEIAARFRRTPRSIRQIEGLTHYRMALDLLA